MLMVVQRFKQSSDMALVEARQLKARSLLPNADSMVAGSVARQIIAPHAAAGSNSRDVEEQVHSEAEGYVDAVEQAVA